MSAPSASVDTHNEHASAPEPAGSWFSIGKITTILLLALLGFMIYVISSLLFGGGKGGIDQKAFDAFEATYKNNQSGLQTKVNELKTGFETVLNQQAQVLNEDIKKLREDYEKNKAANAANFKTLEEGAKGTLTSVSQLTGVVEKLAKKVEELKALPPPTPVPVASSAPAVVATPQMAMAPVVATTGLPLTNQVTASGPGSQKFLIDTSATDQSVADGLDRLANQTKDRVAQSTLTTAARALRGGLKVDPDVRLKLRIIAQGLSSRSDLARDSAIVNEAYKALQ